ncbi:MAG TPA: (2Fe-2S)-binding protein [Spirochaetia bacterium]|nr:(2Fe-2S)-binding protein [Spirochaetia bacterium]
MQGTFTINGEEKLLDFHSGETLLAVLRRHGYTEVKEGCGEGQCGACLVLLEKRLVNSCQVFAAAAMGQEVTTVEGIGHIHHPHPIQSAFAETGAVQCGFCTPGMIMAAYALLKVNPDPDETQIMKALDGNLCRCTGYVKIIEAVRRASRVLNHE